MSRVAKFLFFVLHVALATETRIRVNKALSGPCTEVFDQKIIFNKEDIALDPPNPTIPGTFHINANATVTDTLHFVAAELELRLGDWVSDPLPCQERNPDGCGGRGSCSYCNFCREFTNLHPQVSKTNNRFARQNNFNQQQQRPFFNNNPRFVNNNNNNNRGGPVIRRGPVSMTPHQGENVCPIQPGQYRISTNIDISDTTMLNKNLPNEILNDLSPGSRDIALYTTLWIYDKRFQDLNKQLSKKQLGDVFDQQKKDWIVGCYRIVSTLKAH